MHPVTAATQFPLEFDHGGANALYLTLEPDHWPIATSREPQGGVERGADAATGIVEEEELGGGAQVMHDTDTTR